ncbi:SpaA isopeptide-forming pilin-related protein, partial [Enterococcus sp. LJL128]
VIPDTKETGMSYDQAIYEATVTVADKGGQLEAKVTYKNVPAGEVPVFKNSYQPKTKAETGEILLKKVDSKTGKTLSNAEFKLVDERGEVIKERIVTDETGTVLIQGLSDGIYELIETKAPTGYQLDATPIKFEVKNSQSNKKEIAKKNTPIGTTNSNTNWTNNTKQQTRNTLPRTGIISNSSFIIWGICFLVVAFLIYFGKKRV